MGASSGHTPVDGKGILHHEAELKVLRESLAKNLEKAARQMRSAIWADVILGCCIVCLATWLLAGPTPLRLWIAIAAALVAVLPLWLIARREGLRQYARSFGKAERLLRSRRIRK
ncbi:MAG: hypothetical protein JSS66_03280 [Armatimonadetes bacterium]|nr:hypothetical protein [Armatimonadota bacterium]